MNNPVCPVCRSAESVTVLKSGKRAFCENCESTFDVSPPEPGERKKPLRLFLSYPHAAEGEYNICDDIAAYLMSRGHDVWFDKDQLNRLHGTDWRRKIADGIRSSQLVLSCLNRHAVRVEAGQRGVCLDELSIAISVKGGNINTVLLEPESVIRMKVLTASPGAKRRSRPFSATALCPSGTQLPGSSPSTYSPQPNCRHWTR